jgi:hypothetical protein
MAKLGWAAFGLLAVLVVGLGAARSASPDDTGAKLDELKALMAENNRVQRIDFHRRHYSAHQLGKSCDLDSVCDTEDRTGKLHGFDFRHRYAEGCDRGEKCRQKDAEGDKRLQELERRLEKK